MNGQLLLCGGERLPLGKRIGRGGEGEVHAIADGSGRAVKIYLKPDAAREAKIRMIVAGRLGDVCPNVAFPLDIVRTGTGSFAGFTMPRVEGCHPIHELIATGSRRRFFPNADFPFIVRTATNIARNIASVHAAGVVVGDINSSGFLVSQKALVTLIDADSFQLPGHRCPVGMAEYTPPELQGIRFGDVDRTQDHDAFGLAVLIFQTLCLGRHPFAGVQNGRPTPIEAAIVTERFAYSQIRDVSSQPPPATLVLSDLPRPIGLLFERAFHRRTGARPTPSDWVRELGALEARLSPCPVDPLHFAAAETKRCPWCRIEGARDQAVLGKDRIVHMPAVAVETEMHRSVKCVFRQAKEHAGEKIEPAWHRADFMLGMAARKIVATTATTSFRADLGTDPMGQLIAQHAEANAAATLALEAWRKRLGIWEVYRLMDRLRTDLSKLDHLRSNLAALIPQAAGRFVDEQILWAMRSVPVGEAVIQGIADGLLAQLSRHGIFSAADLARPKLTAMPGLGEARIVALLFWRETVAVGMERSLMRTSDLRAAALASAKTRADGYMKQLELSIREGIADLERCIALVRERASQIDQTLSDALKRRDQTTRDLARTIPMSTSSPASPPVQQRSPRSKSPNLPNATPKDRPARSARRRWSNAGRNPEKRAHPCFWVAVATPSATEGDRSGNRCSLPINAPERAITTSI